MSVMVTGTCQRTIQYGRRVVNVKKIILVLICLLAVAVLSFGQINEFVVTDGMVQTVLLEQQDMVASPAIDSLNSLVITITTYRFVEPQEQLIRMAYIIDNAVQRLQVTSPKALGGVAVRLKYPLCVVS